MIKRKTAHLLLGCLLLLPAHARQLIVTNANNDGEGSLREAILLANESVERDTIRFSGVEYIVLSESLPDITEEIMIDGGNRVTIDADANVTNGPTRRIFTFQQVASFTLQGLTFTGGNAKGGAVYCNANYTPQQEGKILISDCLFFNNRAKNERGGALSLDINSHPDFLGDVNINNTEFRNNIARDGGAISLSFSRINSVKPFQIKNCQFLDNISMREGGAIFLSSGDRSLQIENSIFSNNRAGTGGVVYNHEDYLLSHFINCLFTDNSALIAGVAWSNYIRYENCFLSNNIAERCGVFSGRNFEIINSTMVENNANYGAITEHGIIDGMIVNSTIVGNSSRYPSIDIDGVSSYLWVYNSIITGNKTTSAMSEYFDISIYDGYDRKSTIHLYGSIYGRVKANKLLIKESIRSMSLEHIFEDPLLSVSEEGILRIKQGGLADNSGVLVGKREKDFDQRKPYKSWYYKEFGVWKQLDGTTAPANEITPLTKDQLGNERPEGSISIGAWQYSNNTDIPHIKEDIDAGLLIYNISPGTLLVSVTHEVLKGKRLDVYTLAGALIHQQQVQSGTMTIQLPAGMYIVKVGDETRKIVVN